MGGYRLRRVQRTAGRPSTVAHLVAALGVGHGLLTLVLVAYAAVRLVVAEIGRRAVQRVPARRCTCTWCTAAAIRRTAMCERQQTAVTKSSPPPKRRVPLSTRLERPYTQAAPTNVRRAPVRSTPVISDALLTTPNSHAQQLSAS